MASARNLILPILVSCVFISPLSSQQHSFKISPLLEAKQWTKTPNYQLNTPAPVWIPEAAAASEISHDLSGGKSVLLSHVNHIKTTTVFTSQARLVTADPVTARTGLTLATLQKGPAESPAASFHNVGASETLVDARRSYTAKGTEMGSSAIFNTLMTASATIPLLPVTRPAAAWMSDELLDVTGLPSKCSSTGRSSDVMTHVQAISVSNDTYRTDRSEEETYRPAEEGAAFSTATAMPAEQNTSKPTARSPVEVGSAMSDVRELRAGTESVPKAASSFTATPQSVKMLVSDESSGDASKLLTTWEYVVNVEGEHAGSGDVMHSTFLQQSPDTVPEPLIDLVGLPGLLADANLSNYSTSLQPSSSKNLSSRPSSNPTPEVLSPEVPSITSAEAVAVHGTASARPGDAPGTDGKDLAGVRSASSLETSVSSEDRPAPSGTRSGPDSRPRWLWAVSVPPLLLLLTLLGAAVYWRRRRRRRRKLNISSSSCAGGAGSPWSRPAQPVLHASGRLEPDPDESLAPPPPSYREYQHSASARCVSLELEESPLSSRQTSGTDVSVDSSGLASATGAAAENV